FRSEHKIAPKRLKSLKSEVYHASKRLKSLLLYFLRGEKKTGNLYLFVMQTAGRGFGSLQEVIPPRLRERHL
ncbi:MAG: hypothetical protein LBS88_06550, partial [Tannerellaceae bacterium]|nr:hypothetical protein [Tannerellaceae bacterium]